MDVSDSQGKLDEPSLRGMLPRSVAFLGGEIERASSEGYSFT